MLQACGNLVARLVPEKYISRFCIGPTFRLEPQREPASLQETHGDQSAPIVTLENHGSTPTAPGLSLVRAGVSVLELFQSKPKPVLGDLLVFWWFSVVVATRPLKVRLSAGDLDLGAAWGLKSPNPCGGNGEDVASEMRASAQLDVWLSSRHTKRF